MHYGLSARLTNCSYRLRRGYIVAKWFTVCQFLRNSIVINLRISAGLHGFLSSVSNIAQVELADFGANHGRWHLRQRRLRGRNFAPRTTRNTLELDHPRWNRFRPYDSTHRLPPQRGHGSTLQNAERVGSRKRTTIAGNRMWIGCSFALRSKPRLSRPGLRHQSLRRCCHEGQCPTSSP